MLWTYLMSRATEDMFPFIKKISTILAIVLNRKDDRKGSLRGPLNSLPVSKSKHSVHFSGLNKKKRKKKQRRMKKLNVEEDFEILQKEESVSDVDHIFKAAQSKDPLILHEENSIDQRDTSRKLKPALVKEEAKEKRQKSTSRNRQKSTSRKRQKSTSRRKKTTSRHKKRKAKPEPKTEMRQAPLDSSGEIVDSFLDLSNKEKLSLSQSSHRDYIPEEHKKRVRSKKTKRKKKVMKPFSDDESDAFQNAFKIKKKSEKTARSKHKEEEEDDVAIMDVYELQNKDKRKIGARKESSFKNPQNKVKMSLSGISSDY